MIHGRNKQVLGLLSVVVGLVTGPLLVYWIWEGQRQANTPTSTDWPEWRQKEWEKKQREKQKRKPSQPTNEASRF